MKLFRDVTSELSVAKGRAIYLRDAPLDPSYTGEELCRDAIAKIRAVPESATGKMVIRNFDDHSWSDWFPFAGAVRAPAAGASGRVASEARCFFKRFKSFR